MARFKLILEYDGGPFVGWQRQENGPSVQAALECAVLALAGEQVRTHAAGRTDAGVHALAMPVHFDLMKPFEPDVVRDGLNHHLGSDPISVVDAARVDDDFHARFSCLERAYEFRILDRRARPSLDSGRVWHVARRLNAELMNDAAQALVGQHDFTTFRAAQCQAASPVKTLRDISISREGDEVVLRCAARSFLHHQVRSVTGSLVEVGRGKWNANDFRNVLQAADRTACGPVAPPQGLYFLNAKYPPDALRHGPK